MIELYGEPCLLTMSWDVTEQRQAEEALRQSEQRFSKAFHTAPIGIAISRISDRQFIDVNESFLGLIGHSREEVIGRTPGELDLWPEPGDRDLMLQTLFQEGAVRDFESKVRRKSGEIRDTLTSFVTVDIGGEPCILGMVSDVTERKRAEEALRESEKRLASIYDAVGDVIFLLDVEKDGGYRFTSVNHAFLSVTGLPAEAVVGKRVNDVIPEPSLTLVLGKYRQAVQKKAIVRWEETSDYPAGRLTGEVSVVSVFDEGGNCTHLVGTVHDITERKRGEEELRQSEKRFRDVLDVSRDFIYKLNLPDRAYDYVSPSVLPMSGFTTEEFAAMGFAGVLERFHPEDRERLRGFIRRFLDNTLDDEAGATIEYRWKKKTGEYYWLSDYGVLIRDSDGKPIARVGSARDITERKLAEEALRESEQRFRRVLEVSSDLIYWLDLESGTYEYVSPSVLPLSGFTPEEFAGLGIGVSVAGFTLRTGLSTGDNSMSYLAVGLDLAQLYGKGSAGGARMASIAGSAKAAPSSAMRMAGRWR